MTSHENNKTQHDVEDSPELNQAWSQLSDELPPMAADSAILRKARESVSKKPRRIGFLPSSWIMPVGSALAAGLVIGVAITTLQEKPNAEIAGSQEITETAPALARKQAGNAYSLAASAPAAESGSSKVAIEAREERDDSLITPLVRSTPRAPAADAAVALDERSTSAMRKAVKAKAAHAPVPGSTLTRSLVGQSNTAGTAVAAASMTAAGNSPEAISDTLTEMLDEISDANGELDDRELDLLFDTEDSWLISIQRLITNRNEKRALQLAGEFRERFPDTVVPEHLKGLFGKL